LINVINEGCTTASERSMPGGSMPGAPMLSEKGSSEKSW
jgi:hypothetical protein